LKGKDMTLELLVERDLLMEHRQVLIDAFNASVKDIQQSLTLESNEKMEVLGILARHMKEATDKFPIIKDYM
jgi:hypothetical protein